MVSDVFILGTGGLAREMRAWIATDKMSSVNVVGFIDPYAKVSELEGLPVYDSYSHFAGAYFLLGVGNVKWRVEAAMKAQDVGMLPATYIHSSAVVADNAEIGVGVVVTPRNSISNSVCIEDFAHINVGCAIGHDTRIGSHSVVLGGNLINGDVSIGVEVCVGSGATIHPGKVIGDNAVIGIGAVVIRNVPSRCTVFGNPAKVISKR